MEILKSGQVVQTEMAGLPCTVEQFLGSGTQGEVYRARLDGQAVALKWYFAEYATPTQRQILENLIEMGPPSDKFLWPQDLALAEGRPEFGYLMPLREPRYKSIVDLLKRRVEPSFRALATAGFELAHAFLQLHARGLVYRDISWGNVFFAPDTGDVLICDNDNVTVNKEPIASVLGTPKFMAPEIVRRETLPSTETDLFSLAVLLFYILMNSHPLDGKREADIHCLDLPAMEKLYGTEPVFIFDPDNDSNRPTKEYHSNALEFWPLYPQFLRDLLNRVFTEGLNNPDRRPRENEWRETMVRLRDAILYCSCGEENFYDLHRLRTEGNPGKCWSCGRPLRLPPRIRLGKEVVMLNHDTRLFPHHVDSGRRYDFSQPVAAVVQHPKDPGKWGLKNLTNDKWVVTTARGRVMDVAPGQSVGLARGVKINFGSVQGEIRA